jgi:hypothetical protein
MTRKLNNDTGLQDWKTEHPAVKYVILHAMSQQLPDKN